MKERILEIFAESVELKAGEIRDLNLAQITEKSTKLTNSLDLMEAFARTANTYRRESGIRVRLPSYSLETPLAQVLEAFAAEAERLQSEVSRAS